MTGFRTTKPSPAPIASAPWPSGMVGRGTRGSAGDDPEVAAGGDERAVRAARRREGLGRGRPPAEQRDRPVGEEPRGAGDDPEVVARADERAVRAARGGER